MPEQHVILLFPNPAMLSLCVSLSSFHVYFPLRWLVGIGSNFLSSFWTLNLLLCLSISPSAFRTHDLGSLSSFSWAPAWVCHSGRSCCGSSNSLKGGTFIFKQSAQVSVTRLPQLPKTNGQALWPNRSSGNVSSSKQQILRSRAVEWGNDRKTWSVCGSMRTKQTQVRKMTEPVLKKQSKTHKL